MEFMYVSPLIIFNMPVAGTRFSPGHGVGQKRLGRLALWAEGSLLVLTC